MNRTKIVIAVALVLGSILRVAFLGLQSLEMDELFTAESMQALSMYELMTAWILPDPHLPLHSVILKFWVDLFGDSEMSLRLPSALLSVLALWASYAVGKRVFRHESALTVFVLLNAFSCTAIQYAQQARAYALYYLGALLCTLLFIRLFNRVCDSAAPAHGGVVAYGASALLCASSHYFGFGFVYAQLGLLLLAAFIRKKMRLQLTLVTLILCICTVGWLTYHFPFIQNMKESATWIPLVNIRFLVNYAAHIFGRPALFMAFVQEHQGWYLYTAYVLIALGPTFFLLVPFALRKTHLVSDFLKIAKRPDLPLLPALYLFFVPLIVYCGIGLFKHIVWFQYLICLLPPAYVVIAYWVLCGFRGRERMLPYYGLTSCLCIILLWSLYFYVPYKDDVRSLFANASKILPIDPGALLVVDNDFLFNYYLRRYGLADNPNVLSYKQFISHSGAEKVADAHRVYVISGFRENSKTYWDEKIHNVMGNAARRDMTQRSLRVFLLGYSVEQRK